MLSRSQSTQVPFLPAREARSVPTREARSVLPGSSAMAGGEGWYYGGAPVCTVLGATEFLEYFGEIVWLEVPPVWLSCILPQIPSVWLFLNIYDLVKYKKQLKVCVCGKTSGDAKTQAAVLTNTRRLYIFSLSTVAIQEICPIHLFIAVTNRSCRSRHLFIGVK